ncbi:recombination mediator RecR [Neorickettsia sennetsu]|uniref:Recombination protein RecR n=1 Tax=Ehrlichia sennetsu (strain ATCC VR-367 / Miyayama) TaxID=222891 RepID=RECR_EHRS3|nr:recombination mediator RecR [Neorickettsia sennetsu]Q2GCN1.1 RecName: Full=Recombination protein RecR [Neorickettsia sennetsu str. Miyayama]ABD46346.1 recombination protein RecR [Neorickettsia sennetsu str. Miyayama]
MDKKIKALIKLAENLPGLGPKSARRIVLHLLKSRETTLIRFIDTMQLLYETIKHCELCGNLESESPCSICRSTKRSSDIVCVVEEITDLWAIEKAGVHNGRYHVLNGALSIVDGITPETLQIEKLKRRVSSGAVKELIIATNATVEGQTTAQYIVEVLKGTQVKLSFLAHGIPVGSEMDYLDEGTLGIAFANRRAV